MKKNRQIITWLLSLALMMALLAACGGNSTQEQSSTAPSDSALSDSTPSNEGQSDGKTGKVLVAYFSRTGNTRTLANQIHEMVGGDIVEIQTVKPYPDDYDAVVKQAREERDSGYKPPLSTKVENMDSYDVVYLGYPIWFSTIPAPIASFLSENDFSGKTIVPFSTHAGHGPGQSVTAIKELSPKATVLDGLDIVGKEAATAQEAVSTWLRKIGMLRKSDTGTSASSKEE